MFQKLRKVSLIAYLGIGIILFFTVLMVKITLPYFSFKLDVDFLLSKQTVLYLSYWRIAFYMHISFSLFVLPLGALQFFKINSLQVQQWHRVLGKLYVIIILFIAAPSGFIMALHANGGFAARLSFIITATLWWYFTWRAFVAIKNKKWQQHRAFMIRSYALTLSAISLRLYVLIMPYFINLHGAAMYITVAWLSWIPNMIIAEIIVQKLARKNAISLH